MAKKYSREQILERLHGTTASGKPIIVAGAGFGLVAKCEDLAGVDLIVVYSSGKSRRLGLKTSLIGDANQMAMELGEEVLFVVESAPVIAGIQLTDPTRSIDRHIDELIKMGFSGLINYPSVGLYGREWINDYEEELEVEVRHLQKAKDRGIFTMTYVYRPEEAEVFARAADIIIAHVGWTAGGLVGAKRTVDLSEACRQVQETIEIVKKINSDAICIAHGGPFVEPKDTEYLYQKTDAVGYVGASSIERIPIENAILGVVKAFKSIPLTKK